MTSPTPSEVRALREGAGLTLDEAAARLSVSRTTWHRWEVGLRAMHAALWELARRKIRLPPERAVSPSE